jgi:CopG family transcriptional regulator, nickel-responsive regulator
MTIPRGDWPIVWSIRFKDHHDIAMATMHAHLDHDTCMEAAVLRGRNSDVQHFAEHLTERGVRHGRLYMVR